MRQFAPLLVLLAAAVACGDSTAPTLHLIENGGFETGTFAGWTVYNAPGGDVVGFVVMTDTLTPHSLHVVLAPPESTHAAISDQDEPGTHLLYQDVSLPAGRTATFRATIYLFNMGADYVIAPTAGLAYEPEDNQQFRVDVMDPAAPLTDIAAGVLLNVYQTDPGDLAQSGYVQLTADLTPYAGQTVRIRFAEVDNMGYLHAGVDAVDVEVSG